MRPLFCFGLFLALLGNILTFAQSQPASAPASKPASQPSAPAVLPPDFAVYKVDDASKTTFPWHPKSTHAKDEGPLGVMPIPLFTEKDLAVVTAQRNVGATKDKDGGTKVVVQVSLVVQFTPEAAKRFAVTTANNLHQRFAFVYRSQIFSAPYIGKKIDQEEFPLLLEGFLLPDAQELADGINKAVADAKTAK